MPLLLDRPRSTTEILDAAFLVLRARYGTLVGAYALVQAPMILGWLWMQDVLGEMGLRVLELSVSAVADATVVLLVSAWVNGTSRSTGAAIGLALRRLPALTGAAWGTTILIMFGLALLVLPGLLIMAGTFAVPAAIVLEGRSLRGAFRRASDLAEGQLRRLVNVLVVGVVIAWALGAALAWGLGLVAGMLGGDERAGAALGVLGNALVLPFAGIVVTLLYYDLRIRKEAYDLELLARDLPPLPADAPLAAR